VEGTESALWEQARQCCKVKRNGSVLRNWASRLEEGGERRNIRGNIKRRTEARRLWV